MARNKENQAPPGTSVMAVNGKPVKQSKPRAVWNALTVQVLIATLIARKAEGNQTDNASWKPDASTACETALAGTETGPNGSGGPPKTAKMCATRWGSEKTDYLMFRTLRGLSGFGWNEKSNTIDVEDAVWETYVAAHPKAKNYRYKLFPQYDDMASLVDGGFATGDKSFAPGQQSSDSNADTNNDEDDDDPSFPLDPELRGEKGIYRPDTQGGQDNNDDRPISNWGPSDSEDNVEVKAPQTIKKRTRAMSDSPPSSVSATKRHR
ncbi:hypothetical protein B0H16DRAFT_1751044 [Mycena metata]|uniref:Myb/SANT-like domain-containing protein n=1 Tax=Mycena metata TaxID=1033252 RepID=A0AAD7GK67_9AGAR|nr:hypothetical protein B0H16DRAFT_1751044 [Mycena metata]